MRSQKHSSRKVPTPPHPALRATFPSEGKVGFPAYLAALEEVGYRGFLTIEHEADDDPVKDIGDAADFLRRTIREN